MKSLGLVLGVALGLGIACSIDHPSDALVCSATEPCGGGQSCVNGYCVESAGSQCPGECNSCDTQAKTCQIDNNSNGNSRISCPNGYHCTINCTGGGCRTVDCSDSASCNISCSGAGSCQDVQCGRGACTISCGGPNSCKQVDCRDSCACSLSCGGNQSCTDSVSCPTNCSAGTGCATTGAGCSTCQ